MFFATGLGLGRGTSGCCSWYGASARGADGGRGAAVAACADGSVLGDQRSVAAACLAGDNPVLAPRGCRLWGVRCGLPSGGRGAGGGWGDVLRRPAAAVRTSGTSSRQPQGMPHKGGNVQLA